MLDALGVPPWAKLDRNSFSPRTITILGTTHLGLPAIEIQLHVFILHMIPKRRSPITVMSIFGLKGPGLHGPKAVRSYITTG